MASRQRRISKSRSPATSSARTNAARRCRRRSEMIPLWRPGSIPVRNLLPFGNPYSGRTYVISLAMQSAAILVSTVAAADTRRRNSAPGSAARRCAKRSLAALPSRDLRSSARARATQRFEHPFTQAFPIAEQRDCLPRGFYVLLREVLPITRREPLRGHRRPACHPPVTDANPVDHPSRGTRHIRHPPPTTQRAWATPRAPRTSCAPAIFCFTQPRIHVGIAKNARGPARRESQARVRALNACRSSVYPASQVLFL